MIPEIAIVSGATGGIGKSIASTLAEHGHHVLALGRNIQVLASWKHLATACFGAGRSLCCSMNRSMRWWMKSRGSTARCGL